MAGSCDERVRSIGLSSPEIWARVFQKLSIYFDGEVAQSGKKITFCDVWKCARWCVRVVEQGHSEGQAQVDAVVYAGAGLAGFVAGYENDGSFTSKDLLGCCCGECAEGVQELRVGTEVDSVGGSSSRVLLFSGRDEFDGVVAPVAGQVGSSSEFSGGDKRSHGKDSGSDERLAGTDSFVNGEKESVKKGKNWKKNLKARLRRARASSGGCSTAKGGSDAGLECSGNGSVASSLLGIPSAAGGGEVQLSSSSSGVEKSELASSFERRKIAENKLAAQKAEYQFKKNEYMTRSRVAEQQWETERLTCDQKLQKITEARFGTKPGFAETLVSANISSTSLPSMSQGTLSPDSSISVAEVNKMFKLIADLTAQVAQLTVESKAMKETAVLSAYEQRKLEMENMTFEQIAALCGTEKDIRPDGSPAKYDAIGQEIYSECGRPDFMNQYDYRSSITVSEDGQ